jgi:hypothetical protein
VIYFLTAVGLPLILGAPDIAFPRINNIRPGGNSTVHIYAQTIHRTAQNKQYVEQHRNKQYIEQHKNIGRV